LVLRLAWNIAGLACPRYKEFPMDAFCRLVLEFLSALRV
jgi:hypothetical protein